MLIALGMIVAATGCGKNYTIAENGAVYNDYAQVNKWKGLEVERVDPMEVTDADIDAAIVTDIQTEWKKVGITDRAAANGDTVVIDFVGKKDGVAFEGGSADDFFLELGSNSFIDGFEAGIVGHTPGEESFDLNLTFPETYDNTKLAGQAVVFTVTLDAILPEYSEALVTKLSDTATTTEEYRAELKEEIEVSNQETANASMRESLLPVLTEQCEALEYPEERLEEILTSVTEYYTDYFEYMVTYYYGTTVEEFEATYGMDAEGMTQSSTGMTFKEIAQTQLLCELAIELIAEVEEISCTDEVYEAFLKEQAEANLYESAEAFEEAYEEVNGEGSCKNYCLQELVLDFLWENCKIVEPAETESTETVTE